MTALEPGICLDDKYEILEHLHGGSMGDLYLVRHVHLQAMRVIKLLSGDLASDPRMLRRFRREARTATRVEHPHVATLYDFSQLADGTFYMVWEYIKGETLATLLDRQGRLALGLCLDLGKQALEGLSAIHAAGVLHRDISPDNLLVSHDLESRPWLKIIDLGLARSMSDDSGISLGGKFLYCSPEQAGVPPDAEIGPRSDLYSFSLVLYEMLTRTSPFDDLSGGLQARFRRDPTPLAQRDPEIPASIDRLVMKGLALDPAQRWPDAARMLAELELVQDELELRQTGVRDAAAEEPQPIDEVDGVTLLARVDEAIREVRLDEAEAILVRLEALDPVPEGTSELREVLDQTSERRRQMQVLQTEELMEQYLLARKKGLAEMAIGVLVELEPDHPRLAEFQQRIVGLEGPDPENHDRELVRRAARQAILAGDLELARDRIDRLETLGSTKSSVALLRREADEEEAQSELESRASRVKEKLEELIQAGRLEAAEREVDQLSGLGVPKAVVDLYRGRIGELRQATRKRWQARLLEMRFPRLLEQEQWDAAREAALELGQLDPGSELASGMFAEVSRAQDEAMRRQAIEQGARAVESFLGRQQLFEAERALEVLRRMAPDHPAADRFAAALERLRDARANRRSPLLDEEST